jgi:hypothetical protein
MGKGFSALPCNETFSSLLVPVPEHTRYRYHPGSCQRTTASSQLPTLLWGHTIVSRAPLLCGTISALNGGHVDGPWALWNGGRLEPSPIICISTSASAPLVKVALTHSPRTPLLDLHPAPPGNNSARPRSTHDIPREQFSMTLDIPSDEERCSKYWIAPGTGTLPVQDPVPDPGQEKKN